MQVESPEVEEDQTVRAEANARSMNRPPILSPALLHQNQDVFLLLMIVL